MTITLNGTTGIQNVLGSAAAPAESNTTNSNTGVYFPTSTSVGFSANGAVALSVDASNNIFYTGGTERARIDSSGNLLVGQTTNGSSAKVGVLTGNGSNGITVTNTSGTATYNAMAFYVNGTSYTNTGTITVSGSTTSYNTSSDYRLKNTIVSMTGALAKVAALNPCTYKWNVDGSDGQGFIAHELAEVCPNAVVGEKDAVDADGNPVHQGVDTSFLVATLTAAIQEQQALITQLTDRIAALEAK